MINSHELPYAPRTHAYCATKSTRTAQRVCCAPYYVRFTMSPPMRTSIWTLPIGNFICLLRHLGPQIQKVKAYLGSMWNSGFGKPQITFWHFLNMRAPKWLESTNLGLSVGFPSWFIIIYEIFSATAADACDRERSWRWRDLEKVAAQSSRLTSWPRARARPTGDSGSRNRQRFRGAETANAAPKSVRRGWVRALHSVIEMYLPVRPSLWTVWFAFRRTEGQYDHCTARASRDLRRSCRRPFYLRRSRHKV